MQRKEDYISNSNFYFRNGIYNNSPLIGKYCGDIENIPNTIKSFSNHMYLKFVSDTTEVEKGFEIEWDLLTVGKKYFLFSSKLEVI